MLILADSGILLRLLERSDPLHPVVRHAVQTILGRGDELVMSLQNVAEFWNGCTRPASSRGGYGLDTAETGRRVRVLERLFQLRADHPDTYRYWRQLASASAVQGRQVHDCRIAAFLLAHGISHILTLNGRDFVRYPGITVLDPTTIASTPPAAPGSPTSSGS